MSVAKKIVLSVGFLVVMFAAYGFYANHSSSTLNENTVSVFKWAHVINVGSQVQALSADGREYELMRIMAPNEAERSRAEGLISQLTPKLNKAYEEYEQAIQEAPFPNESDRSQKLARISKLKEERKEYADVRQRATDLMDAGDHDAAITLALNDQSDVYKRMTELLEEDKADSVRLARAEMAYSEDVFSGVKTTTLIALVIVVILSVITLVLLLRSIKRSVDTILDGARHIAGGDLRSKIELDGDDEFAHIAHQFNTMVESMQKMIRKIKATATDVAGSSEELTANASMRRSLAEAAAAGVPIYAECGGYMYLMEKLVDFEGKEHAMTGIVPAVVQMNRKLQMVGYVEAELCSDTVLGPRGRKLHGHEFHFSTELVQEEAHVPRAFTFTRMRNGARYAAGYAKGAVLGSYLHLHFAGCPEAAKSFIEACRLQRERVTAHG